MKPLLVGFFALTSVAFGQTNKIEGAFGLKLGDTFEPKEAGTHVRDVYKFKPTAPVVFFTNYFVSITPISKRIYNITAVDTGSRSVAEDRPVLTKLLTEKYGPLDKATAASRQNGDLMITRGKRYILITENKGRLAVAYTDEELEDLADKEHAAIEAKRVESESKKTDKSGL